MNVSSALHNSVEQSMIELTIRKGIPVLPNGELSQALVDNGYASSAWQDREVKNHIAGGSRLDDGTRKWVSVEGCKWNLEKTMLSREDMTDGKVVLEVTGLTCSCGQYAEKTIRYQGDKQKILSEVSREMLKHL
ncbi:MAG: hypothetical protein H9W81_13890 [Enterococcus sp.]|nr:hypothetical protein [Enterococcus sp.]